MLDKKIIYFLAVVEKGSFSGAGRELFLSQAAVSQQMVLLEQELGIPLFDRHGYRPILTKAGEQFYEGCISIQNQCKNLQQKLQDSTTKRLRVGFPGSFESKEFLSVMNAYKKKNPDVTFSFLNNTFNGCVKDLLANRTDLCFGLSCEFKDYEEMIAITLFPYQLFVICSDTHSFSKQHEIAASKLYGETLVVLSAKYGKGYYKEFMKALHLDQIKPKQIIETDTFDELLFHVSVGNGIGITSDNVVKDENIRQIRLVESHHKSEAAIAYLRGEHECYFTDFVEECKCFFEKP